MACAATVRRLLVRARLRRPSAATLTCMSLVAALVLWRGSGGQHSHQQLAQRQQPPQQHEQPPPNQQPAQTTEDRHGTTSWHTKASPGQTHELKVLTDQRAAGTANSSQCAGRLLPWSTALGKTVVWSGPVGPAAACARRCSTTAGCAVWEWCSCERKTGCPGCILFGAGARTVAWQPNADGGVGGVRGQDCDFTQAGRCSDLYTAFCGTLCRTRAAHASLGRGVAPDLVLSNMFLDGKDPQRDDTGTDAAVNQRADQRGNPNLLVRFTATLHVVGISGLVFTTGVNPYIVAPLNTPLLQMLPVTAALQARQREFAMNDFRFVVYLDALQRLQRSHTPLPEYIAFADLFDSVFQHSPFAYMRQQPSVDLFMTSVRQEKVRNSPWDLVQHETCIPHWSVSESEKSAMLDSKCVCPGIWGGKSAAVLRIVACIVDLVQKLPPKETMTAEAAGTAQTEIDDSGSKHEVDCCFCDCAAYSLCMVRAQASGLIVVGSKNFANEPFSNSMWNDVYPEVKWPIIHRYGADDDRLQGGRMITPVMQRLQACQAKALPTNFEELVPWLRQKSYADAKCS